MDILQTNLPYNCYCGTGEANTFAATYIFDGKHRSDPSKVKIAIVSDRIVSGYYYNRFEEQFILRGVKPVLIPVECEGGSKELSKVSAVYDYLTDFDFGSDDWLIALGGGGILDVAGFCASVFNGGINFIAVPTTPDAMYEGSVALNAYLDSGKVKNALAVPFRPETVIIDPSFLGTVPDKISHNGYADIIRLGILGDPGIMTELVRGGNGREFLNRTYALRKSINDIDPRLLSLGNEISSAIEGYFRFMNYSEGEALALSLLSCVDEKIRGPVVKIYELLGLPVTLKGVSAESIMRVVRENLTRNSSSSVGIVDMGDTEPKRWIVRSVSRDDAEKILEERLHAITSENRAGKT
ncbi:MAG: iron-containing alcohol dehydrogenase [Clostridiales bacterium]|nr:iron-containing alcohol dehydrogenase [Clostridiales bacterium]